MLLVSSAVTLRLSNLVGDGAAKLERSPDLVK